MPAARLTAMSDPYESSASGIANAELLSRLADEAGLVTGGVG